MMGFAPEHKERRRKLSRLRPFNSKHEICSLFERSSWPSILEGIQSLLSPMQQQTVTGYWQLIRAHRFESIERGLSSWCTEVFHEQKNDRQCERGRRSPRRDT